MLKLRFAAVLVITIFLSSFSWATTYYVDAVYGNNSNSGTSTSSPWKTIAKVNSFTFKAGDNILFKRGATWKEQLTVRQNGTSTAPITFGAYGSGNRPVIDGSLSRNHGIYMNGRAYIIVRDFKIQNTKHGAVRIDASRYITVRDSEMYVNGRAGVFIQESNNCLVRGNKMSTPATEYNVQTDGIYAQRNSNNTYDGNHIVISNRHTSQHCDAIQFFQETSATVKNNYVEQNNTKGGNAQGIYCSENYGTFRIFNNIGYGMYTTSSLIKFKNSSSTYNGKAQVIGNTLYGGKGALVQTNDPYIIFKNNIIVTTGSAAVVSFEKTLSSSSNINHNLYRRSGTGSSVVIYKGSGYKLSSWKSAGFDTRAIESDPKFASVSSKNFTLASTSPALDKGVNMSSPFNIDRIGTARPYSSSTDIGAYEMKLAGKILDKDGLLEAVDTDVVNPEEFELAQNYPNPFNPTTTISYSLPEMSEVSLKVYDITGSEVMELVNTVQNAGNHQVNFNASNLASGTYIYMIKAKDFVQTKKMILLK